MSHTDNLRIACLFLIPAFCASAESAGAADEQDLAGREVRVTQQHSVYLQDFISVGDKLRVLSNPYAIRKR